MEINGRVHCFFEQSGTFKQEFIKLGIPAEDYDIQNNFGQTDHEIDLFAEIERAYGGESLFDTISKDDLIMAFFPCIYFCAPSQMNFTWGCINYRNMTVQQKTDAILERDKHRAYFYGLAIKMFAVAESRGLRLIMENPWSENTYLKANFIIPPAIVDNNRMMRGDYRVKPTAYWFVQCEPTHGKSIQFDKLKEKKTHMASRGSSVAGVCSEERSMISPDYARNFICDFILGKKQTISQPSLFD
ncbi:MAG: hypothetical protein IKQ07_09210 [Bacteroidaceae bacterium]|nr:hypothetical protein [Bacteroidaceae bacterium]